MVFVRSFPVLAPVLAIVLTLPLAACGKGDKNADLNALDAALTDNVAEAIIVDPRKIGGAEAKLPVLKGDAAKALAQSVKLAGGKLLAAPAAGAGGADVSSETLAQLIREQQGPGGNATCRKQLVYGMEWASRLPEPFTAYPGADLKEAAGADKNGCTLRGATFVTPVPRQSVMDYYYTQARRAGYDVEHRVMDGDHVLGGTRKDDGGAFFLLFTDAPGGRTTIDIIADKGR